MELCNLSYIRPLLERHGFRFSKSLGQNFLVDKTVPERIVSYSGVDSGHGVIEVGPGIGPLTYYLSGSAAKVVCVELDEKLLPVLSETMLGRENVEIINGDILKVDINSLVSSRMDGLTPIACANLPYYITTPAIAKLLEANCFDFITVMIQKEVAARITARAGTSEYGAFSVFCAYYSVPEILFDVPNTCFYPQPKVTSSVVKLNCLKEPPCEIADKAMFFRIVKLSFAMRRKTLVNGLSAGIPLSKQELSDIISSCGFDPGIRGERLDINGFAAVANAISARLKSVGG